MFFLRHSVDNGYAQESKQSTLTSVMDDDRNTLIVDWVPRKLSEVVQWLHAKSERAYIISRLNMYFIIWLHTWIN